MTKETHTELDEKLICSHLSDVTANGAAWVLLQEPGFIGFGLVQSDKICWPPDVQPDWARVSDLRLFGEDGEWHVWPYWDGTWQSRRLELQKLTDTLTERHALWGTQVELGPPPWIKLVEDRGAEIWLPLTELGLIEEDLPLRLELKQVIDYDDKSGLAGIVDAVLVALVRRSGEKIGIPRAFSQS